MPCFKIIRSLKLPAAYTIPMLKYLITVLLFVWVIVPCHAQDVIVKRSGKSIKVKILKVTATEVQYKRIDIPNSYLHTLLKSEIQQLNYENGTVDSFYTRDSLSNQLTKQDIKSTPYKEGMADAKRYYKDYKTPGTFTLAFATASPALGLLPALFCSTMPPGEKHLGYPNADFKTNSDYANGYMHQAKRIKAAKVWKNWGIGLGINVVALVVLLLAQPNIHYP